MDDLNDKELGMESAHHTHDSHVMYVDYLRVEDFIESNNVLPLIKNVSSQHKRNSFSRTLLIMKYQHHRLSHGIYSDINNINLLENVCQKCLCD